MAENEWKMLVKFMLFVISRLSALSPLTGVERVNTEALKDELELELK